MPPSRAIHPAWRPITSTTIMRWCALAVVSRRSRDSDTIATALLKPKVTSVAPRSLSMVFGTPTTGRPISARRRAVDWEPSPPTTIRASSPRRLTVAFVFSRTAGSISPFWPTPTLMAKFPLFTVPRMVPPLARRPRHPAGVSPFKTVISFFGEKSFKPIVKTHDVPSTAGCRADNAFNDCVQAGTVPAAIQNTNIHMRCPL